MVINEAVSAMPDKLPVNPKVEIVDPVTIKDPVITAFPVNGKADPPPPDPVFTVIRNVDPLPFVKVIVFKSTDAVVNSDPVGVDPPPLVPVNPLPSPIKDPENEPLNIAIVGNFKTGMLNYC